MTLRLPLGLLVFGLLDFPARVGTSVDTSSELTLLSSGVFSLWRNYRLYHHDIV